MLYLDDPIAAVNISDEMIKIFTIISSIIGAPTSTTISLTVANVMMPVSAIANGIVYYFPTVPRV